ncbi:MAG: hypothetical protein HWE15_06800 [Algoriphagus sp.]|uniref:hypothetical protein n=1 Tax=Algoriphagus sp. TaxID=1872435 RepID=UPI0017D717B2|nr:hypothetical protein [Algoriphagus sp.]NVJ85995.1 hypothetical protein [Algoriphagus sp.]
MKQFLKSILATHFKEVYFWQQSYRFRRQTKKKFWDFQNWVKEKLFGSDPIKILSGPFVGLKYYNRVVWGPITPKWIGCYEEELHDIVNKIIEYQYDIIIDVGAAEGYYAVGLAKSCTNSIVYSFDIDPFARELQKELASINKISNLVVGTYCDHRNLDSLIHAERKNLIICDIEGFEYYLLNPKEVHKILCSDILVEIHPFDYDGIHIDINQMALILIDRFNITHEIKQIEIANKEVQRYRDLLRNLSETEMINAMNEYRLSGQKWLWIRKKTPN